MADIDKALPNVKQTINIPSPQDVEIAEQEKLKSKIFFYNLQTKN